MKNLLFATGIAVLAAGACNSTRDGMSDSSKAKTRDEMSTTTTTTDRTAMTAPAEREMAMEDKTMPAKEASTDLTNPNTVLEAANTYGGLTKVPVSVATQVIDGYIGKLSAVPSASSMVTDLKMVKMQLNSGSIDGMKVGEALKRLGMQTKTMADGDAGFNSLGMALEQTGKMLTGK